MAMARNISYGDFYEGCYEGYFDPIYIEEISRTVTSQSFISSQSLQNFAIPQELYYSTKSNLCNIKVIEKNKQLFRTFKIDFILSEAEQEQRQKKEIAKVISFLEDENYVIIQNVKDLHNYLEKLLIDDIEDIYIFLQEFVQYLRNKKIRAELSVYEDEIFIHIFFKKHEPIERIDKIIDELYDLLGKWEYLTFINIGDAFEN